MSKNKANVLGNLGKVPEIRNLPNGGEVATFSVATSTSWKDKESGERKSAVEWHNIVCFNAGIIDNYIKLGIENNWIKKGTKVDVEGMIKTRKWTDKNGIDKYSTEIVLEKFGGSFIVVGKTSDGNSDQSIKSTVEQEFKGAKAVETVKEELDDDIPF